MPRDAHIPLFLWIATAVLIHLLSGGGADKVSDWFGERLELRRFAEGVRTYVKTRNETVEVTFDSPTDPAEPPAPSETPEDPESAPEQDSNDPLAEKPLATPSTEEERAQAAKPEPKPTQKPPEPEKKAELTDEQVKAAQELMLQKKISVRQHVEDKEQADNPDAELLSEHNNKVREQSQARITSNDENDPNPTPGANAGGIGDQPGNATETRVASNEDRPGEDARAPSDEPAKEQPNPSETPPNAGAAAAPLEEHLAKAQTGAERGADKPEETAAPGPTTPGSKGQEASRADPGAPDLVASNQGQTSAERAREQKPDQAGRRAQRKRTLPRQKLRGYDGLLGLGASGTTANGINLNLTPGLARDAIGLDQLSRERRADGARRKSQHLGSWKTAGLERWRSAIENYVPSVKPGNQTALNTARAPFATYLSVIHNRLHPIFADWYLSSLDSLPGNHPLQNMSLNASLEIVLDEDEGRVVRLGVTKASGVTMFDVAALDSTERAAPFGRPPREIVSPDGRVYLHWEFHRNPAIACTTFNARPYILKGQPKPAPVTPPAPRPDQGAESDRHGSLWAPQRF